MTDRKANHDLDPAERNQAAETGAGKEAMPDGKKAARTHESGYGGRGGDPKTSSDQREPSEPTGKDLLGSE